MQPYTPTKVPVTVYRSTDAGAPQLKDEPGSLKILLKTCLVSGYGGKQGLGWQMHNESGNNVVFHFGDGFGLAVDDNTRSMPRFGFVAGANFGQNLGDPRKDSDVFGFHQPQSWMLVGHAQAFALILSDVSYGRSQILLFGLFAGVHADNGNILYLNTANMADYTAPNDIDSYPVRSRIAVSQYFEGGLNPYRAVNAPINIQFLDKSAAFPDPLYQGYAASRVSVSDNLALRCLLPLYCSYHALTNLKELDDLQDGAVKLNLSQTREKRYCFALDIEEWEV